MRSGAVGIDGLPTERRVNHSGRNTAVCRGPRPLSGWGAAADAPAGEGVFRSEVEPLMDWSKLRAFLWGGLFGSLLGFLLAPHRRGPSEGRVSLEEWEELAGAPCGSEEDGFE